jgi:hypothetical protein
LEKKLFGGDDIFAAINYLFETHYVYSMAGPINT